MPGQVYMQSGWVVRDLMAAAHSWLAMGVGPFFIIPKVEASEFQYRGSTASLNIGVALAQAGGIQIELIQPNGDSPSPYRDMFPQGEGFHHFAALVDDLDAAIELRRTQGALVARGVSGDMRFAYLDTRDRIGCMTELMQPGPEVQALFAMIDESSKSWNGADPIRFLG